jgi:hypothetical protein
LGSVGHYYERKVDNNESKKSEGKKVQEVYVCMHRWFTIASQGKKNACNETSTSSRRSNRRVERAQMRGGRHLMHLTQHPRLTNIRHVDENIISRMRIQRRPQPLLVKVVTNEPDTPAEHEQTVEGTDPDVLVSLLGCEGSRVMQEVDEADSDATVNVEDELR